MPHMPFVTLWVLACINTAEPDTCIKVQVDAPSLSFGSCMGHEGANIARDYLQQHPVYGKRWRMGGWQCAWGSRAKPREEQI